ncbi:MAG: hemerythrin domain-containing protein [Acidobacteriota bacterium]
MVDPVQELKDDHRIIEKVLTALTAAAEQEVPVEFYERAVDFIVNFADGCHHSKEEERLFPLLEARGIPREGGPIGCMCHEHEIGRDHVKKMRESIAGEDRVGLRQASLQYVALLRDHIHKEDQILFPMGLTALSEQDLKDLRTTFDQVEEAGQYQPRYQKVADELLAQVGEGKN